MCSPLGDGIPKSWLSPQINVPKTYSLGNSRSDPSRFAALSYTAANGTDGEHTKNQMATNSSAGCKAAQIRTSNGADN